MNRQTNRWTPSLVASLLALVFHAPAWTQPPGTWRDSQAWNQSTTPTGVEFDVETLVGSPDDFNVDSSSTQVKTNYGPPASVTRGTLLQWSYGTSFTGGPDLEAPLVTDRPDVTEAPSTVGRRVLQIEAGYTYFYDDQGPESGALHSIGEPLFRYGIFYDWLELRLAFFPLLARNNLANDVDYDSGIGDLNLGLKFALTPQEGILPEVGIITALEVPIGSDDFSSHTVEPSVHLLYGWQVTDEFYLGGCTLGGRRVDDSDETYFEFLQAITSSYRWTDQLSTFAEWYASFPNGANVAQVEHILQGGFIYLINNNVQFDIRTGVGLNDDAPDFLAGVGLSVRFLPPRATQAD